MDIAIRILSVHEYILNKKMSMVLILNYPTTKNEYDFL